MKKKMNQNRKRNVYAFNQIMDRLIIEQEATVDAITEKVESMFVKNDGMDFPLIKMNISIPAVGNACGGFYAPYDNEMMINLGMYVDQHTHEFDYAMLIDTLLHEMRHYSQRNGMSADDYIKTYHIESDKVGYTNNKYERDAREFAMFNTPKIMKELSLA